MRELKSIDIIGLTKKRALAKIEKWGYESRITREDGRAFIITRDWRVCRFNLVIENNIVVSAELG